MTKIELSEDAITEIVKASLKESISYLNGWDNPYNKKMKKTLLRALMYYSTYDEMQAFIQENPDLKKMYKKLKDE